MGECPMHGCCEPSEEAKAWAELITATRVRAAADHLWFAAYARYKRSKEPGHDRKG